MYDWSLEGQAWTFWKVKDSVLYWIFLFIRIFYLYL